LIAREGKIMATNFSHQITINGRAAGSDQTTYENSVKDNLISIMMFETGRAVIRAIESTHRRLFIIPRHAQDQNATSTGSNNRDSTIRGDPLRDSSGRVHREWGVGSGHGANSVVRYTPWLFPIDLVPRWDAIATANWLALGWGDVAPGLDSEEILLHEMVHSLEHMTGTLSLLPLGYGFDTLSEFHSILVVNLYQREQHRRPRLDHHGFNTAVSQDSIIPSRAEFWQRVDAFRVRHPQLAKDLAAVEAAGNPFRNRPAPPPPAPAAPAAHRRAH
jgi:hypothetical protein